MENKIFWLAVLLGFGVALHVCWWIGGKVSEWFN
jgi:hypothetical protein